MSRRTISVVDYDPKWPELFQTEAKLLREILKKNVIWIEHIGSTAVSGLCAKPIIDILIGVRNIKAVDRYQNKMELLGYHSKGEFSISGRRFFIRGNETHRTCHIHIFQMGHSDIARHINFKYYLIDHPIQAKEYGRLKKSLAARFPHDIEQYMLFKKDLVQRLEQKVMSPIYLSKRIFETQRLVLRPWKEEDTLRVQHLFHDKSIADRMLHIPYPCDEAQARKWIKFRQEDSRKGRISSFAIVLKNNHELIGAITFWINREHQRAKFSYWVGKFYRNHGYCTEAARKMMEFGFTRLGLNRIYAQHFASNPASGKVLQKIDMQYEGYFREYFKKGNGFKDSKQYAILATDHWNR